MRKTSSTSTFLAGGIGVILASLSIFAATTFGARPALASVETSFRVTTPVVPIVKEGLSVRIHQRYAVSEHIQIARNGSSSQTEGQYLFSVGEPSAAVVTKFVYWNGDEPIRGELFERDAAVNMYDTVTRARRDPGVLEQTSPGSFRYRIFPFAPNEMKRIDLRWESWLPSHGRVVEYRVPLASPRSSIFVSFAGLVGAVWSETHEIEVLPNSSSRGETRVRAIAPRESVTPAGTTAASAAPSEFVLHYELPATQVSSFVHVDQTSHDAFVVLDVAPPDRLIERVRFQVDGAVGVRLATPLPTVIGGERVSVAFRCHPNKTTVPLRARIIGELDGKPIVFEKEIDVSSTTTRAGGVQGDAPWAAMLWATSRAQKLARESSTTTTHSLSRDEIVELGLSFDFTTPHTAFFAIPASEAVRVQGQLADARGRKRLLTADGAGESGIQSGPTTGGATPAPMVERSDYNAPRSGGCAGCTAVRNSSRAEPIVVALGVGVGVVVVLARRRRRRPADALINAGLARGRKG